MAVNPKTPGVYLEEIPVLPASVAEVATAIPAFIGYVEKAENGATYLPLNVPVRITSLKEFETLFGTAEAQSFQIDIDDVGTTSVQRNITASPLTSSKFKMYYQVQMFYLNGGGPCYIVPVGFYSLTGDSQDVSASDLTTGLAALAKYDEPTLLVFPDVMGLVDNGAANANDYETSFANVATVYNAALDQCNELQDRFTIMDVVTNSLYGTDDDNFRSLTVGINNLKYGAAYYPDLNSTLGYVTSNTLLHINSYKKNGTNFSQVVGVYTDTATVAIDILNKLNSAIYKFNIAYANAKRLTSSLSTSSSIVGGISLLKSNLDALNSALPASPGANSLHLALKTALEPSASNVPKLSTLITATTGGGSPGTFYAAATTYAGTANTSNANGLLAKYASTLSDLISLRDDVYEQLALKPDFVIGSFDYVKTNNPALYSLLSAKVNGFGVSLSPCGAVAGIYARVDNDRGVWKAPANVGVFAVTGPVLNITNAQQDGLNVDPTGGKSINCVRAFTGRGTIVWGARTLAGNDNEWRYVNVRRFFNFAEESIRKATAFVVFEPNNANTWLRVKGMIDAFLTGLWRDGALAGATTKEAFFVNVGLGTTMNADDILNGRMIVEVGLAAVRPAEFIILRFEHKLQES